MINWGILSTAKIARKAVMPAIKRAANANLYAIASSNQKVNEIAREFSIPHVYTSYEDLLDDPTIHAVYIPLPNTLHKEWVIKAAQKGKHVLCEKPAALSSEDALEMISACEKNNVLFMEAFMYQFQPQHRRVKEWIENGEIGDVKQIRSAFTFKMNYEENQRNIRLNQELGGGSIWDIGCYCIHASRYLLEQEPIEVYVKGKIHSDYQVDTRASGILTFPNDVTVSFDCSFEQPMAAWYEVLGTKGMIKVPHAFRSDLQPDCMGTVIKVNEEGEEEVETFAWNQYELQVEHFSECMIKNKMPSYSGTQTVNNIKVIEASYQSLKSGLPVTI